MTALDRFLKRSAAPAWLFFALALVMRVFGVTALFHGAAYFADEAMYLRMADVVAGGQWLGEGVEVPPGLVYVMGFGRMLGLDPMGLRYLFCLIGAGMVAVVFLVARRIFGARIAGLATLVLCGYPYLIYLCGTFFAQAVFQLTLALVFYYLLRFIQEDRHRYVVWAGFWLGISALTVVPVLSAAPLLALWIMTSARGSFGRRFLAATLLAGITLSTILPWTARNYHVAHRFIFVGDFGGGAFYWANNAKSDPFDRDAVPWLERNLHRLEAEQKRQAMTGPELARHMAYRSQRFWKVHTGRAVRNYFIRLSMFFDVAPRSFTHNEHTESHTTDIVAIVTSVPVLLLAPVGWWLARRRWRLWWPLAAVPLGQAISYAAFHVSVRYRFPYEPYLILFAVVGVIGVGWPAWMEREGAG